MLNGELICKVVEKRGGYVSSSEMLLIGVEMNVYLLEGDMGVTR